jgi:hypothetical protein
MASPGKPMQPTPSASEASPAPQPKQKAAEPAPSARRTRSATVIDPAAPIQAAPQAEPTKADAASRKAKNRTRPKQQPPADRELQARKAKPAKRKPAKKKEEPKKESSGCGHSSPEPPWALEVGKPQDEASAGKGQPRWVCDQTTVKAEPVWEGKPVTFKFAFRNEGQAVLRVKARGGWGVKIAGRSDRSLQPGERDSFEITLSSRNRTSGFTKRIQVTTNDPNNQKVTLMCQGTVLVPFKAKPARINFGRIERNDEAKTQTVTLTRGDGGPIHPEVVRTGSKEITATLREIEPGARYDLDIHIQPPWPNTKRLRSWVRLKTGVSELPETTVPVYAAVVPKVEVQPQWFSIRLGASKELKRSVRLQWHDNKSHEIQELSVNDPNLKVQLETRKSVQNVVLTVPAGYENPGRTRTVMIKTGDAEVPVLRVPIRFSGKSRSAKANRARNAARGAQRGVTGKARGAARTAKKANAKPAPEKKGNSASAQGDAGVPNTETAKKEPAP